MTIPGPSAGSAALCVPEIRDYERINAELAQRLDEGYRHVRLMGAEGQRFLAAGLSGMWDAEIEIEGRAGPELAAGLNAPNVTVICRGPAADGAGRSLRAGQIVIVGDAGEALGYAMEGGTLMAGSAAGARAGLNQYGGTLFVRGIVGRLAAERQSGGRFLAYRQRLGPNAGRGRRGGRLVLFGPGAPDTGEIPKPDDFDELQALCGILDRWMAPTASRPDDANDA